MGTFMGQSKPFTDSFDQTQIEMIELATERAWSVIRYDEHGEDEEARSLLSLCVMNEARSGEDNHINLVNRAIVQFRRQRAQVVSERRRQA
jgi:hypothetical protein